MLKRVIYLLPLLLSLLLLANCALSPEDKIIEELVPKLTDLDTPANIQVLNNHADGIISITWDPVENATFYTVEYERTSDYLESANPIPIIRNTNSVEIIVPDIESETNQYARDKRYIFRIKATCLEKNDNGQVINTIESAYSDIVEGAIADYISITCIQQDRKLVVFDTVSNVTALDGSKLADLEVRYFDHEYVESEPIDPDWEEIQIDGMTVESGKDYSFTAVLYADGVATAATGLEVSGSIDYNPPKVVNLKAENNLRSSIILRWDPVSPAAGVDGDVRYAIQKKPSDSAAWEYIQDPEGSILLLDGTTYEDTAIENNKDYDYRVLSAYLLNNASGNTTTQLQATSEAATVEGCHAVDNAPEMLVAEIISENGSEENGPYESCVKLTLDPRSKDLLDCKSFSYVITRRERGNDTVVSSSHITGTLEYEDEIILTEEEHRLTHIYYYTVEYYYDDELITPESQEYRAVNDDGSEFAHEVKGTVEAIDFIQGFAIDNENYPLAGKIRFNWDLFIPDDSGLSFSNLLITLTRTGESGEERIIDNEPADRTSRSAISKVYEDTSAEQNQEYEYQLIATYSDSDSLYDGMTAFSEILTGHTLQTPENLTASMNTSETEIRLEWDAVQEASGYLISYRLSGSSEAWQTKSIDDPSTTAYSFTSADSIKAGKAYDFYIQSIDAESNATAASKTVEGSMLGPIDIEVEGGPDYIRLTWDEADNVNFYTVIISASASPSDELLRAIATRPEYELNADDLPDAINDHFEYPLSEEYYFAVLPGDMEITDYELEEGNWIRPPKNITASKAGWNVITIEWEAMDAVEGYNIYRREHGSTGAWDFVRYTSATSYYDYYSVGEYDYTVSSIQSGQEGPMQTDFASEDANYGYPLMQPKQAGATETASNFLVYFNEVKGATKYNVTLGTGESAEILASDLPNGGSNFAYDETSGRITVSFPRVTPEHILTWTASIIATNTSLNDPDRQTTEPVSLTTVYDPSIISEKELINLSFRNLSSIVSIVDNSFENEWWVTTSTASYNSDRISARACSGSKAGYIFPNVIYNPETDGYIHLDDVKANNMHFSGELTCYVAPDQTGGAMGDDPLERVSTATPIRIVFPYSGYRTMEFTFNNYYVRNTGSNNGGTVSLAYVENGVAGTATDVTSQIEVTLL